MFAKSSPQNAGPESCSVKQLLFLDQMSLQKATPSPPSKTHNVQSQIKGPKKPSSEETAPSLCSPTNSTAVSVAVAHEHLTEITARGHDPQCRQHCLSLWRRVSRVGALPHCLCSGPNHTPSTAAWGEDQRSLRGRWEGSETHLGGLPREKKTSAVHSHSSHIIA